MTDLTRLNDPLSKHREVNYVRPVSDTGEPFLIDSDSALVVKPLTSEGEPIQVMHGSVRVIDYLTNVGHGHQIGSSVLSIMGYSPASTVASTAIWPVGTVYTFPTSPMQMEVVSSSAEDSAEGTGIRKIFIDYLDGDYVEHSEIITLNGLTPVFTAATDILRINWHFGYDFGSTDEAAGNIDIRHINNTPIYSRIAAGRNSHNSSAYTVPAGKHIHLRSLMVSAAGDKLGSRVEFSFKASVATMMGEVLTGGTVFFSHFECQVVDGMYQYLSEGLEFTYHEKTDTFWSISGEVDAKCYIGARGYISLNGE